MSDVMLYGVLRMPYKMAMGNEFSRYQFYQRAQEAADRLEAAESAAAAPVPASTGRESFAMQLGRESLPFDASARELDVEAERLTDNEIECMWHEACLKHLSLDDSAIPDFARAIEAKVDARFRAEGGKTKPDGAGQNTPKTAETRVDTGFLVLAESAQVSTEQAGDAPGRGPRYTCIGKGGDYELIGEARGAGSMKLNGNMAVYRDTASGALYYRATHDFNSRMAPNNSPVGADRRE